MAWWETVYKLQAPGRLHCSITIAHAPLTLWQTPPPAPEHVLAELDLGLVHGEHPVGHRC